MDLKKKEPWQSSHHPPGPLPEPNPFDNYFMRAPNTQKHLKSTIARKVTKAQEAARRHIIITCEQRD
jgi:hypothetical protein